MDVSESAHPSEQTLRAYSVGKLYGSLADSVQSHLSGCGECRRRAAEISADTLPGALRDAHARPDSPAPVGLSMIEGNLGSTKLTPANSLPQGLADHPDYEIVGELGSGGMGVVYLAWNKLMGRKEVLKVVSSDLMHRRRVLDRFLREIRNAAQLHHPNIVTAYAAIRAGESIVFAMEYVEGYDLDRLVAGKGPLPVAQACNFIYQAALGLQYAHEKGMVHRDIKPSNLILSRHGKKPVVKVLDFGLAKATREGSVDRSLTHEGQMLGTPDYIAPEQSLDAQKADIRADIYSLGCTLYYLLSGAPPFTGSSLYEVLQAHHSMDATPLNVLRPDVPLELAAVIAKMMAKDPDRRYQTPIEVAKALKPFYVTVEGRSVEAKPERSQTSQAPPAQRLRQNSGKNLTDQERALITDRQPLEKRYRSRQIVSNQDAPEAAKPIPRIRGRSKRSLSNGGVVLVIGVAIVAMCAIRIVFRGSAGPETRVKSASQQPINVAQSNGEEVIPARTQTRENAAPPAIPSTPAGASAAESLRSTSEPRTVIGQGEGHIDTGQPVVVEAGAGDRLPAPPQGKTWTMVWHDEFDGTKLDTSKWTLADMKRKGGWWSPKAVSLDERGHLVIKTYKEGNRYLDGCVSTDGKFEHAFGYYVARLRFQREPGHWAGVWVFSPSVRKVGDGGRDGSEIDIVTSAGAKDRVFHSFHWDGYGKDHRTEAKPTILPGITDGFHTFGLLWNPEEYVFYIDGQETWRTSAGGVSQVPEFLMISDEVLNSGGDITHARLPDEFLVDYVRVYDLIDEPRDKRDRKSLALQTRGDSRLDSADTSSAQLRISISKEGECRIILGRGISETPKRSDEQLVAITDWLSSRPSPDSKKNAERGSLLVPASDKRGGMLVYPGAFRLPCTLSLNITELKEARLGVQFISRTTNIVVYVDSDDGLRERATLLVSCANFGPEGRPNQSPIRIERPVQLSRPDEFDFRFPQTEQQLARLLTLDVVFFPSKKDGPPPSGAITDVTLRARRDRPLGLGLKVEEGQVAVERVAPDGLAAAAGVKVGDVITALDGKKIPFFDDSSRLPGIVFGMGIGRDVRLTLRRGDAERLVTIQDR
jgi:serine/threonine protein kinase